MNYKKIRIGFNGFEVGDIVLSKDKGLMYIILKVNKCRCPCNKTRYIKRLILPRMEKDILESCEYAEGKREVIRGLNND